MARGGGELPLPLKEHLARQHPHLALLLPQGHQGDVGGGPDELRLGQVYTVQALQHSHHLLLPPHLDSLLQLQQQLLQSWFRTLLVIDLISFLEATFQLNLLHLGQRGAHLPPHRLLFPAPPPLLLHWSPWCPPPPPLPTSPRHTPKHHVEVRDVVEEPVDGSDGG